MRVKKTILNSAKTKISDSIQNSGRMATPVSQTGFVKTQRWKIAVVSALLAGSIFVSNIRPAHAFDSMAAAAAIIASDNVITTAYKTFESQLQTQLHNAMMSFLQQQLMGFLQKTLLQNLGSNFGNLIYQQLASSTSNAVSIAAAKNSVLSQTKDQAVKTEVALRMEKILGTSAEHGNISDGSNGGQKGEGGTSMAVVAARIAAGQALDDEDQKRSAQQIFSAGKKDIPGAAPNSKEMAKTSEKAANAMSQAQSKAVSDGMKVLDPKLTAVHEELVFDAVFAAANVDMGTYKNVNEGDQQKLTIFLTPQPIIPANAEPAYDKDALQEDKLGILVSVMIGQGALPLLPQSMFNKPNAKDLQLKLWTKFARLQLARTTLMWTMMPSTHASMKEEYRDFVLSPNDAQASLTNGGINLKLLHQMRLTQGTNMSLMRLREIQMDQTRLLAVLLTATMEQTNDTSVSSTAGVTR